MNDRVYYWRQDERIQNFGDSLSRMLSSALFFPLVPSARAIHLIGSVIDDYFVPGDASGATVTEPVVFWGCGLRQPGGLSEGGRAGSRILAVRGPLSASELRLGIGVPQGDPGLLMPLIYQPRPYPGMAGRTVCVPHFHDARSDAELIAITGCDLVLRPNIGDDSYHIERFIDGLVAADFVLSGSLHAAIVAAAYGRPFAFWDSGNIDLPFKWADFAASVAIPAMFQPDIASARTHYDTVIRSSVAPPPLWPLLASAPLLPRPEAVLAVARQHVQRQAGAEAAASLDPLIATFSAQRGHFDAIARDVVRREATLETSLTASESDRLRLQDALASAEAMVATAEGTTRETAARLVETQQRLAETQQRLASTLRRAKAAEGEVNEIASRLAETQDNLVSARQRAEAAEAELCEVGARFAECQELLASAVSGAEIASRAEQSASAHAVADRAALMSRSEELRVCTQRLEAIEASTTWRATYVLRKAADRLPKGLRRAMRRMARVVWWSMTLTLPRRLAEYQRARAAAASPAPDPVQPNADPTSEAGPFSAAELSGQDLAPPETLSSPPTPEVPEQTLDAPAVAQAAFEPVAQSLQQDAARIRIASALNPEVSIIIPTYGQVAVTLCCLRSIMEHPPRAAFEVLVADDASGDLAVEYLRLVDGIRLVEYTQNKGFVQNCNDTAMLANGTILLFLNNDTELTPGAVESMLATMRDQPGCGLVGAKLVYPDGRLQEAGGIIWNDGSAWNYGRDDEPGKPQYCYPREADYCSGAALLVPADLFRQLGGFDMLFSPAYYEDTDLAFRIRAAGRRVIYDPGAVVVHHEGASHGTDVNAGVKTYQIRNRERFHGRWQSVLQANHFPPGACVMRARDRAAHRPVVLIVDHYVPQPDRDAGSRAIMGVIRALLDSGMAVKFWPSNLVYHPHYTPALQALGVEAMYGDIKGGFAGWMAQDGIDLDFVIVSRPEITVAHIGVIQQFSNCPIIYFGHDLHCYRMRLEAEVTGDDAVRSDADRVEQLERESWSKTDLALYLSKEEADRVRLMEPRAHAAWMTPYGFDSFPIVGAPPATSNVIFVAGFAHPPNVDAAAWLVESIVPRVLAMRPDARFNLVGSNPTARVRALAGLSVNVTGYVTDEQLADLYATSRVAVVPLRFGAGVKSKVVEALRHGLPLVTTAVGLQGLTDAQDVVRCDDDPARIAQHIVTLLSDDGEWRSQAERQVRYAEQNFSSAVLRQSLRRALGSAVRQRRGEIDQIGQDAAPPGARSQGGGPDPIIWRPLAAIPLTHGISPPHLPLLRVTSLKDYEAQSRVFAAAIEDRSSLEADLVDGHANAFSVRGHCVVCGQGADFQVSFAYSSGADRDGRRLPNWREQLTCPRCGLINRLRAVLHVMFQEIKPRRDARIYITEQVTPLYAWLKARFPNLAGSEYFGPAYSGGDVVQGVRHEDIEELSFRDGAFDVIMSFEVLEHVPHEQRAFAELARCLAPGGTLLFTAPFGVNLNANLVRARLQDDGTIAHLMDPEYHGNPVDPEAGALCFRYFGWEVMQDLRAAGLVDPAALFYWSRKYGYLGGSNNLLVARKPDL